MVKKMILAAILAGLLVSAGLAQEVNPQKKVHTRPPYSGPRHSHAKFNRPLHRGSRGLKAGHPQPKSDHVIAR